MLPVVVHGLTLDGEATDVAPIEAVPVADELDDGEATDVAPIEAVPVADPPQAASATASATNRLGRSFPIVPAPRSLKEETATSRANVVGTGETRPHEARQPFLDALAGASWGSFKNPPSDAG
jgi:hypothetical protein